MINILYLHAGAELYGSDKILLELVGNLNKKIFKPVVILPSEGILKDKLENLGISTYVVKYPVLRRRYFNLKGIKEFVTQYFLRSREIVKILNDINFKVDIVHANTVAVLEGIYIKKKLHSKLVWHIHEIIEKPKIVNFFLSLLIGLYSDKCVAVSKSVKMNLIRTKVVSEKKVEVIYNGVDNKQFNSQINFNYLFKEFNISENSIKIGVIGRINAWKGQEDFIEAAAPLLKDFDNLYLIIVGSAFEGQEWRVKNILNKVNKIKNSDRIIYSPFRFDNAAIQNFLDVLVLPSINPDPLPTVVLEAMACGKPIVGYKHGGVTEMVINSYNGFLVEPRNVNKLRGCLENLLNNHDEMKIFGENSENRQRTFFSIQAFENQFEKLYRSLI